MTVKGISIEVGQAWVTAAGRELVILNQAPGRGAPWQTSLAVSGRDSDGVMLAFATDDGHLTNGDRLSTLCAPASQWLPRRVRDDESHDALPLSVQADPCDANAVTSAQVSDGQQGIGDVLSTRKGSGARYNAGKPPLDLIPLSLTVPILDTPELSDEQRTALHALDALGMFQAREGKLSDVLRALGDGWDECAHVFDYGRRKYAAWNWAKGMPWSVPLACAARHLMAIIRGETTDPESGLSHRGHVFCNLVMLGTYHGTFTEGDDRPARGTLL